MITKEQLEDEKKHLIAQRDNAFAVFQQANGAVMLVDALLQRFDGMTLNELKDALGAQSVELQEGGPSGPSVEG